MEPSILTAPLPLLLRYWEEKAVNLWQRTGLSNDGQAEQVVTRCLGASHWETGLVGMGKRMLGWRECPSGPRGSS